MVDSSIHSSIEKIFELEHYPVILLYNELPFTSESVSEGHPDKIADQISGCNSR